MDGHAPIELKVEYGRVNTFLADYLRNIVRGATFVKTERPLAPGTSLTFRLLVPGFPEPVELLGEVVATRAGVAAGAAAATEPGMDIRLLFRDEEERRRFHDAVERLVAEQLGELAAARLLNR